VFRDGHAARAQKGWPVSIAGVGTSLIRLLDEGYQALNLPNGPTFKLCTTTDFKQDPTDRVSLFLYRIEVDPTQRHRETPPKGLGTSGRSSLALNLRYLLTVWVSDAELEHQILQDCMEIFEQNAILTGPQLDPKYAWDPSDAIKVSIDSISPEDTMRLWDLLEPKYRVSIPYLVRTVKIASVDQPAAPPVLSRVNVLTQGVP
jgi:hypothetical protein